MSKKIGDTILRQAVLGAINNREQLSQISLPKSKPDVGGWIAAGAGALGLGGLALAVAGLCLAQILLSDDE